MTRSQTSRLLYKRLDHMDCLISERGSDLQWINSIVLNEKEEESDNPELIWEKLFDVIDGEPNPIFIYSGRYKIGNNQTSPHGGIIFPRYKVMMGDIMRNNCLGELSETGLTAIFSGFIYNDYYALHMRNQYYNYYWHDKIPGDEMLFTTNGYQLYRHMFDTKYWMDNKGVGEHWLTNYGMFCIIHNLYDEYYSDKSLLAYIPINKDTFKMGEIVKIHEWNDANASDDLFVNKLDANYTFALATSIVSVYVPASRSFICITTIFPNGTKKEKIIDAAPGSSITIIDRIKIGHVVFIKFNVNSGSFFNHDFCFIVNNFGETQPVADPIVACNGGLSYHFIKMDEENSERKIIYLEKPNQEGSGSHLEIYDTYDFKSYGIVKNYISPIIVETPCESQEHYNNCKIRLYFDDDDSVTTEDVDENIRVSVPYLKNNLIDVCFKNKKITYDGSLVYIWHLPSPTLLDVVIYIDNPYFNSSDKNFYSIPYQYHFGTDKEINEALWDTVEGGYEE